MSFHGDVLEGINAFTAMRNATKPNPYEEYYKYLMENSPQGQAAKAKDQAAQDMKNQGFVMDPNTGQWVQQTASTGGGGQPMVTSTGINMPSTQPGAIQTTALPPPSGSQPQYRRGGVVRKFQGGGDVSMETPEERERRIWGDKTIDRANAARDAAIIESAARRPQPGEDRRGDAPDWPPPADTPIPADTGPGAGYEGGQPYAPTAGHASVAGAILPPLSSPPPALPPPAGPAPAGPAPAGPTPAPAGPSPAAAVPQAGAPPGYSGPNMPAVGLPPAALQTAPGGAPASRGGAPAPRGGLGDQSRTAAFDPTADANDPRNVHAVDTSGRVNEAAGPPSPEAAQQALNKAVDGGAHFGTWVSSGDSAGHPHGYRDGLALRAGVGAMPANVAAGVQKAWSNNGQLTPGQAMIRYMVYQHQHLSENGQTAQANQMAFEVLQRLNLEASRLGDMSVNALHGGDLHKSVSALQTGHDMVPDGFHLAVAKDGSHMTLVNQFTGQASPPIPVTPQTILAGALALRDGSAMWQYLGQRAALVGAKPDKDAEGRALRNRNAALRGVRLQQQIDKAKGGGGGGTNPNVARLDQLISGKKVNTPTPVREGSNDPDPGDDPVPAESDE